MDPSIHLSPTVEAAAPALQGSWQIGCSLNDAQTTYGWGGVTLYYAITVGTPNEVTIPDARGLLGYEAGSTTASGNLLVQGSLGGSHIKPKFSGVFCHHDQQNSPLVDVWGQDIVVPPQVSVSSAYNPTRLNDAPVVPSPIAIDVVPDIPVGQPLVINLNINAHPQATETVLIHYEGGGVLLTDELHAGLADYNPMVTKVTPSNVGGTLQVWAELRPTKVVSNTLKFHVVADPNASSSSSGSSGASSTGGANGGTGGTTAGVTTAGSSPDPAPDGCSSTGGLTFAALLGVGALGLRRRRH